MSSRAQTEPAAAVAGVPLRRRAVKPAVVLAVASMGLFMAFMDDTVVGIAFPNLVHSFPGASFSQLSWVLNAYNIALAVFLVPAGRFADLIGRRRSFSLGLLLFTASSALCALAPSVDVLIGMRAVQGIGAAIIVPASLALVLEAHSAERRAQAVGVWSATAALAAGIGPTIGGVLVDAQSWRLVFLVNVPIGLATWMASGRELVESRAPGHREMPDVPGIALLALSLATLTLAIVQGPEWGWLSAAVLGSAAVAAAAGWLVVRRSRTRSAPVIERELLRMPGFTLTGVLTAIGSAGFFAIGLTNLLYLMVIWRYSPLKAGLAITPAPFVAAITALATGRVAGRVDRRRLVFAGSVVWTAGPAILLARMTPRPDYLGAYLPAAVVMAIGVGMVFPLVSDAVVSAAPRGLFAGASALNSAIRQLGATVGLAILAALVGSAAETGDASPFRRGWVFAVVCFGTVALGSLALRPFGAPVPETDEDLVRRRELLQERAQAPRPRPQPAGGLAAPVPSTAEGLLAEVPLLAALDPGQLAQIAARCQTRELAAGEWLFRAGDAADAMYVVRSGRLEVMGEPDGRPAEVMRELGPGSAVGELAPLSGGRRSASIRARRDAVLLRLAGGDLDALLEAPGVARSLTRVLGRELQLSRRMETEPRSPARTIALTSLAPVAPGVQETIVSSLQRLSRLAWLDRDRAEQLGAGLGSGLAHALDHLERDHDVILLLAGEARGGEWADACIRQADRVVVLLDRNAGADGPPAALRGCDAVLLSPAAPALLDALAPRTTQRIGAADGREEDLARLARRLAGRSVGLVLSGGGARGFAHIGAIEELLAAGIAIDRVGGSSMGAFVGALLAMGMDASAIDAVCYEEWVRRNPLGDYRLPRRSLIKGARARAMVERALPGLIEDLQLPFYCVSTDIIAAELVVHRRGQLALAVGASMALPGVAPPQPLGDRLLVDGGVLDNLPVSIMAGERDGPVIACDASEPEQRALAPGEAPPAPGLIDTLARVMLLGTTDTLAEARRHADLVITPAHESVGRMEFHAIDRMRDSGRRAAIAALESAPAGLWV